MTLTHPLLRRYRAPADDNSTGGTAPDRGDDFTPTPDADDTPSKAASETQSEAKAGAEDKGKDEAKAETKAGAKDDDSKDEETKDKKSDKRIPLSRHEELLRKERQQRETLEARLAQYEKGNQVATANDKLGAIETKIVEAEGKVEKFEAIIAKAIADGELDKAALNQAELRKINKMIRELDQERVELKSDMKLAAATAQATEAARYNVAIERVEEAYPQLNEDSDEYDEELAGDVADLMTAYRAKGMTPTVALQKAVKRLLPAPESKKQRDAVDVSPRPDPAAIAEERKKAAVDKAVETTKQSPPSTKDVGMDSDKAGGGALKAKDIIKLPFSEFAKLSEDQLARARGDAL